MYKRQPYVSGREKSRPVSAILDEVHALAARGVKEVMLLGQNVNSYGSDGGSTTDFAGLLRQVHEVEGIQRIRFMTSHPKDFSKPLMDTIAQLPKVCRQFHLPIQSGCDKTLSAMHRRYTTEDYWNMLCYLREIFPEATITTDIMVGFPGETAEDFSETLAFVERCQFDVAYTFISVSYTHLDVYKRQPKSRRSIRYPLDDTSQPILFDPSDG